METLGELGLDIKIDWRKVNNSLKRISASVGKVSSNMSKKIGTAMRAIPKFAYTATKKVIGIFVGLKNKKSL